ncbi:hypothetical protein P3T76_013466 [Phytophthora citrophthora]|uniref:Uncharacterized protein n=1 Tax=Phytophthora citrophthora TaxID=4793 RepID=A0AAD9LCW3_9STRA|nr:hypothetical protein P3T76_013466 [Phytophthora citrophthora]
MVRLGLSDSMRSTVSVEDMVSLNTATDRQPPSRPDVESVAAVTEVSDEQQTQTKAVLLNPLRRIRGSLLAFILLFVGIKVLSLSISTWMKSSSHNGLQFERLERSIELLGRDTSKMEISANRLLHSVQEAHVAASGRTEKLQNIVKQGFEEQMKMQIQENEQVMNDVLQYYRQQEKKIMETRERLMKMNITLPVEVAVRAMPEALEQVRQKLLGQEEDQESSRDGIVEGPPSFSEKSSLHDNDVQEISNERRREEQSMSYGSFFFYIFVIGSSAGYLWNAVSDAGKTKLVDEKWEWSPIPTILTRLKELIGSVVVRPPEFWIEGSIC